MLVRKAATLALFPSSLDFCCSFCHRSACRRSITLSLVVAADIIVRVLGTMTLRFAETTIQSTEKTATLVRGGRKELIAVKAATETYLEVKLSAAMQSWYVLWLLLLLLLIYVRFTINTWSDRSLRLLVCTLQDGETSAHGQSRCFIKRQPSPKDRAVEGKARARGGVGAGRKYSFNITWGGAGGER